MIDAYELAMLPVSHMLGQADPFDRYCNGSPGLDDSYRNVVNTGVWVYQLHAYHALIGLYFGDEVQGMVQEYQLAIFEDQEGAGQAIKNAMQVINGALNIEEVRIQTEAGEISMPVELNVALTLLLHAPTSPDFVETHHQRKTQINRMGRSVDWRLARCLASGRDEIVSIFSPLLAHMDLDAGAHDYDRSSPADPGDDSGR